MEWVVYGVIGVYLIGAIYIYWQCDKYVPADTEHRELINICSALCWPIGILIYLFSPTMREERRKLNEQIKEAERERLRKMEEFEEKRRKAEKSRSNVRDFYLILLDKQLAQLKRNLAELEEDDPGRAILKENIKTTEELLEKHKKRREQERREAEEFIVNSK